MILSESELELSDSQLKLIESGWGKEIVEDTVVKKIVYDSDGIEVEGHIAFPKQRGKYPLIIWNRGGNRNDGKIDSFLAKGLFGEIASWGYVVLASQYRSKDEFGGADVNDILNLIPLAKEIENCNSDEIGMEGWSRGGMMSYIVLTKTDKIKCAVIISGLADLFRNERQRSGMGGIYRTLFGNEDESEFKRRMEERSAVFFADKISRKTDILLIHGTNDAKVTFKDSAEMEKLLTDNGVNCELVLIDGGDHYLRKNRSEIAGLRKQWFNKHLKN